MRRELNFQKSTEAATGGGLWFEKAVLRNFANFTGKHPCQSLFFNKVAGLRPATLLKKTLWYTFFILNFAKFIRKPILQITAERLLLHLYTVGGPFLEFLCVQSFNLLAKLRVISLNKTRKTKRKSQKKSGRVLANNCIVFFQMFATFYVTLTLFLIKESFD